MIKIKFRHEWKHEISYCDLLCLRQRLRAVASPDPHATGGSYLVRSLYFDNAEDKALREKLDGVKFREKFRLRYYSGNPNLIHLEKKSKFSGLGSKESTPVTTAQVQAILAGDTDWMASSPEPLIRELHLRMLHEGLLPRTIVDYTREPYVYAPGNVRVTLDYDIRTGFSPSGFLDPGCPRVSPVGAPIILEVKWDEFLPDIIRDAVQLPGRHTAPFSKYAICRIYG